jgi:hypothetical protein
MGSPQQLYNFRSEVYYSHNGIRENLGIHLVSLFQVHDTVAVYINKVLYNYYFKPVKISYESGNKYHNRNARKRNSYIDSLKAIESMRTTERIGVTKIVMLRQDSVGDMYFISIFVYDYIIVSIHNVDRNEMLIIKQVI